jgi:hypothetical protein
MSRAKLAILCPWILALAVGCSPSSSAPPSGKDKAATQTQPAATPADAQPETDKTPAPQTAAQEATKPDPAAAEGLHSLIVYGDDFAFSVHEPTGWKGDIDNAAGIGANIVFYKSSETFDSADALIRVRIDGNKTDENTTDENTTTDLAHDMDLYRSKYPKVEFRDLDISHPDYRTFPKLFFVPGEFYEYVAYLNPDPSVPWLFSSSMNKPKTEATAEELEAFRAITASVHYLALQVQQKKGQ